METVTIGIGEFKVTKEPCSLESISLGSCVGIVLYDPVAKIGSLAHVMLPDSSFSANPGANSGSAKFADIAIKLMLEKLYELGAHKGRIAAKIAGGACMFRSAVTDPAMNIGDRNVEAVRKILSQEKINIVAEDTGSNYGRTIIFDTESCKLIIRSAKYGIKEL